MDRLLVMKVAGVALTTLVPMETPLSLKMIVPVGAPAPGVATLIVAVNVSFWPKADGLADAAIAIDVFAWLTV